MVESSTILSASVSSVLLSRVPLQRRFFCTFCVHNSLIKLLGTFVHYYEYDSINTAHLFLFVYFPFYNT